MIKKFLHDHDPSLPVPFRYCLKSLLHIYDPKTTRVKHTNNRSYSYYWSMCQNPFLPPNKDHKEKLKSQNHSFSSCVNLRYFPVSMHYLIICQSLVFFFWSIPIYSILHFNSWNIFPDKLPDTFTLHQNSISSLSETKNVLDIFFYTPQNFFSGSRRSHIFLDFSYHC